MKEFLKGWAVNTLSVLLAVAIVPGLDYQRPAHLLLAALLLGVLNAFFKPLLIVLSLPLLLFSLGFFMLVINALLLWFTGWLLQPAFTVDGFWTAFFGAIIISITSSFIEWTINGRRPMVRVAHRAETGNPRPPKDDDNVIDVG